MHSKTIYPSSKTIRLITSFLCIFILCQTVKSQSYEVNNLPDNIKMEWVSHYASGLLESIDITTASTCDSAGNVYITGSSGSSLGVDYLIGVDYCTEKYDASGKQIWTARYDGPGNASDLAKAIAVNGSGNVYVTGTSRDRRGFIYTTIKYSPGAVNVEKNNKIKARKYHLSQNYPNPFNPETCIRFDITEKSHVKLQVFDINGKRVSILADNEFSTGSYRLIFNGNGLPSGIYFYKFETNKIREVREMIFVK